MDLNKIYQFISSIADKGVIGKTLPINKTSAQTGNKAKIAAIIAAVAGLLGAIAQYLS
jgi:hypothetical protein